VDNEIQETPKKPFHAARIGETSIAYRLLVRKPFIEKLLGRPRKSSEVNVRWIFRKLVVRTEVIRCYSPWLGTYGLYDQAR
jgi:hypothetical protein